MVNVAALKKKAADFELKKQFDKAIATYQEILAAYDAGAEDSPDVGLYNRVGDLLVRIGNVPEAVTMYERAVDLYESGGFFNNAIALCNKILRTSPGRAVVYYKLGRISAAKGFKGEAKQNFLEYAERMRNVGDTTESFRALKEFVELCPDQDDIRMMLADQLSRAGRTADAVEQLQRLYVYYQSLGRVEEAEAAAARLRAMDPTAAISAGSTTREAKRTDLVFLDLDAPGVLGLEPTSLADAAPERSDADRVLEALPMLDMEQELPGAGIPPIAPEVPPAAPIVGAEDGSESLGESDERRPSPPSRRSSVMLADSVSLLRISLASAPEDHALRREYAEALLDRGDRELGLEELQSALDGFEQSGDVATARSVVNELLRLQPESVRLHRKRVELTARANDTPGLVEAYLALADALTRDGQPQEAQGVYQRVRELAPDDPRPVDALASFGPPPAPLPPSTPPAKGSDDDYVSLGDWLREDEEPRSTRMVVGAKEPTGDESADFTDMLTKFKQGVAESVDDTDSESHYDLGVAFKEMGLVDEAIAEFQKALRGTVHRVRTFESLGQCFIEKGQWSVAHTILHRAINEPGAADEQLVGVLYMIGSVSESMGALVDAKGYFERVFAVDIRFRDVGDRLNALNQVRS